MKRVLILSLITCLFQASAFAADKAQAPATMSPFVQEIIGANTDATLGPALYPMFTNFLNSTNAECQEYLEKNYSAGGFSLAPICQTSKSGNGYVGGACNDFLPIDTLAISNLRIDSSYRKSAKILVTWTVRLEGASVLYSVNPEFCTTWYGTVTEAFPKGKVKTALYVNGIKMGNEVALELPATSTQIVTEAPAGGGDDWGGGPNGNVDTDPTLVGSYVLKASDFPNGQFPASIDLIEVRWKNETPMNIRSPKGMRSILINFLPVTKQK
jgi:hypothetical protein